MGTHVWAATQVLLLLATQVLWSQCQTRLPPWVTTQGSPLKGQTFLHLTNGKALPYQVCYAIREQAAKGNVFHVDLGDGNEVKFGCKEIFKLGLPCNIHIDDFTLTSEMFKEILHCNPQELFVELPNGILMSYDLLCAQLASEHPKIAVPALSPLPDVHVFEASRQQAQPPPTKATPPPTTQPPSQHVSNGAQHGHDNHELPAEQEAYPEFPEPHASPKTTPSHPHQTPQPLPCATLQNGPHTSQPSVVSPPSPLYHPVFPPPCSTPDPPPPCPEPSPPPCPEPCPPPCSEPCPPCSTPSSSPAHPPPCEPEPAAPCDIPNIVSHAPFPAEHHHLTEYTVQPPSQSFSPFQHFKPYRYAPTPSYPYRGLPSFH